MNLVRKPRKATGTSLFRQIAAAWLPSLPTRLSLCHKTAIMFLPKVSSVALDSSKGQFYIPRSFKHSLLESANKHNFQVLFTLRKEQK